MSIRVAFSVAEIPIQPSVAAPNWSNLDFVREEVFRIAYSMTLDYATAEDISQDCLLRIWRNRDDLAEASNPKAWVTKVVVNRVRSHWQRRKLWLPFASQKEPSCEVDAKLIELRAAIDSLPRDCREVVVLVCIYGASYAEAALALSIPEGTVASRVNRGRELLKSSLEDGI